MIPRFWLMMTPAILGFLIFSAGPMLSSLYLSCTKYDVVSPPQWVGLNNYFYLLHHDPAFWPSVKVTAIFATVSVPLSLLIALLIAMLLNQKVLGRSLFRTIFFSRRCCRRPHRASSGSGSSIPLADCLTTRSPPLEFTGPPGCTRPPGRCPP